jgi:hypothetical protein
MKTPRRRMEAGGEYTGPRRAGRGRLLRRAGRVDVRREGPSSRGRRAGGGPLMGVIVVLI